MSKSFIRNILNISIGAFVMALALRLFLEPNGIAPGGTTGFAVSIKKLYDIPVYITNLLVNLPLFVLGVIFLGAGFGWKMIYATSILSLFLNIIPNQIYVKNQIIAMIFGGIILGIGIGIILNEGATTGGSDSIGALVNHFIESISIPNVMIIVDGFVIIFAGLVNKNFLISAYSLIAMILMTNTIRKVISLKRH